MNTAHDVNELHDSRPKARSRLISYTLLLCSLLPLSVSGSRQLTLNTAFGLPFSSPDQTGFFDRLISEAFHRNGIDVSVQSLPGERALINANEGIDDGDGLRILELNMNRKYPNLVRVPEKIIDVDFVVYTNGTDVKIDGWESLVPYNVGIVWGWKILERNIVGTQSLVKTRTPQLLMQLLQNNRTDLIAIERWTGLTIARKLHLTTLKLIEPPLISKSLYLYLHKKHKALIPKIVRTLREMKQDGTYERIKQESLPVSLQRLPD